MTAVAVIGAGIGGLSTALALAAEGLQVTVLERAERFEAAGAGLVLTPNAVQTLARFGVSLHGAQVLTQMAVCGRSGRQLNVIDLARLAGTYGPSYAIARPRLHALLAGALPPSLVEVLLGAPVTAVWESGRTVTVTWTGGERSFDAVVAADGLRSTVRPMIGGPQRLRYSRNTCWRGIAPLDVGSAAVESWGDGSRVGVVPLGDGQSYYYLVRVSPAGVQPPASVAQLKALFTGHGGTAGHLVNSLSELPPLHHDLFELDKPFWGRGRVLLLGDAAHSMTPNQGQGAAMAIEDALAVALALRAGPDGALERYRAARERRVRQVQLASRRIGTMANLRGPGVARMREAVMRLAPSDLATTSMQRLVRLGMPVSTIARPAPLRRAALVAGWTLIVLGISHIASFAAGRSGQDEATRRALDGLAQVTLAMPGPTHTLADLFIGFSLTMAVLLATVGTLLVVTARRAEQAPGLLVGVLWVTVAFAGTGLVLSWLFLPLPPVVGLAVALVAGLSGLVTARRAAVERP